MEKMVWEKPQMNEAAFAANDSVSACMRAVCVLPLEEYNPEVEDEFCWTHGHSTGHYQDDDGKWHRECMCGAGASFSPDNRFEFNNPNAEITEMWVDTTPDVADDGYTKIEAWDSSSLGDLFSNAIGGRLNAWWNTVLTTTIFGYSWTETYRHEGYVTYDGSSANHS